MSRTGFACVALIVIAAVGGGTWWWRQSNEPTASFRTTALKRGDLVATISATGTVEPEETVDIGAQVAGQIRSFGKDKKGKQIDYGSAVEADTILAKIDESVYEADVSLARASLDQSRAGLVRAEADVLQLKAKLDQARRDWERAQKLGPSEALAPTTYDSYRASFEIAGANLAVGKAAVEQSKAAVNQSQATLDRALRNLSYCTIKSPVNGVIIDRRVNIGQTVVSSLNAPSLFLLAKDLKRVQVWIPVNEADIGNIHAGQPVTFTVDAFPGQVFQGQVGKVRLNATMSQNVVTFTVEVVTENPDGRLLPYLTANVQFESGRRENVLLAPNAALRWTPKPAQIAPDARETSGSERKSKRGNKAASPDRGTGARGTVWIADGKFVRPLRVKLGLSDGAMTEVEAKDLPEGAEVVVGEAIAQLDGSSNNSVNPFQPQFPRGPRGGSKPASPR